MNLKDEFDTSDADLLPSAEILIQSLAGKESGNELIDLFRRATKTSMDDFFRSCEEQEDEKGPNKVSFNTKLQWMTATLIDITRKHCLTLACEVPGQDRKQLINKAKGFGDCVSTFVRCQIAQCVRSQMSVIKRPIYQI